MGLWLMTTKSVVVMDGCAYLRYSNINDGFWE